MGIGAGFAAAGYGLEGADASRKVEQNLAEGEQLQQVRGQEMRAREQGIQKTAMGLEDLSRQRATDSAVRAAGAANAGGSMGVTLDAQAAAAEKAGDTSRALEIRKVKKGLEDEGFKDVIHTALTNPTPGSRPDLAAKFNAYGKIKIDPATVTLDDAGNMSFTDPQSGQPSKVNLGKTGVALGLVKPWQKEVPANGMLVTGNNADGSTQVIRNEGPAKFDIKDGIMFNDRTGAFQQVGQGEWKLGHIVNGNQEVPVSINSKTGEIQQLGPGGTRTGLEAKIVPPTVPGGPTMIALPGGGVAEFKPAMEATPGKSGFLGFGGTPGTPAQPASIAPIGGDAPPIEGAKKAPDGKWYVPQGQGWAEVVPKGSGGAPQTRMVHSVDGETISDPAESAAVDAVRKAGKTPMTVQVGNRKPSAAKPTKEEPAAQAGTDDTMASSSTEDRRLIAMKRELKTLTANDRATVARRNSLKEQIARMEKS